VVSQAYRGVSGYGGRKERGLSTTIANIRTQFLRGWGFTSVGERLMLPAITKQKGGCGKHVGRKR